MRDKFEMLRVLDMVEWGLLGAADADGDSGYRCSAIVDRDMRE